MMKGITRPLRHVFSLQKKQRHSAIDSLWLLEFPLIFCLSVSGAFAQSKYKIVHIPTPTGSTSAALGLNESGQVVGYSFQGEEYKTFLYI
jgi:hypothetical protein